ncbi:MAG TPA: sulfurtransferase, partial [Hyphomicrobiaceae bacterium]|nr:sulfurtransferase [Hyphomicrobiaceae bacterium]
MGNFFISIDELKNLIGTAAAPVIYDTCRAPVYSGHQRILPTARWRDHTDVETWLPKIPAGAHVVVNCVHGHNVSQLAVSDLRRRGVNAQTLFGGIDGWIAEDGPTILKAA